MGSPSSANTVLTSSGTELWHTTTLYDAKGRAYKSISATGQTSETLYDTLGRQIATLGSPQTLAEAGLADHILSTAPNPAVSVQLRSETVYDAQGRAFQQRTNIRQLTRADGTITIDDDDAQTTTSEFDNRGQVVKTTFTDGSFVSMTYDDRGRKLTETNQMGQTRTFEYDLMGRLKSVTLPQLAGSTEAAKYLYSYDAEGRQTSLIDPLGRETTWEFDSQGRQVGRTLPLGDGWTERMEYDNLGRQKLAISFEGVVTEYVYDQYGRMSEQRFFASMTAYDNGAGTPTEVWTTTEDAFGRMLSSVRSSTTDTTKTTTYQYDNEGRTTQIASPEGTISYTYDIYGRKSSTVVGTLASPQRTTSYTYDSQGRLKTVSEAAATTTYSYELNGLLDKTVLPNGVIEDYTYDSMNRLDKLTDYKPDGTPNTLADNPKIAEYDYTVLADGRRTDLLERFFTSGGVTENSYTWSYDALNRLTSETIDSTNNSLDRKTTWSFDLTGNRLNQILDEGNNGSIEAVTSYTYDANDRLIREQTDKTGTAEDSTTFYGYDQTQQTGKRVYSGLQTSEPLATSQQLSATSFSYDLQGRMSVVTITSRDSSGTATRTERTSYDYNSMGIRVSAVHEVDSNADGAYESVKTTTYLGDPQNFTGYAQTIRETVTDSNGAITKQTDYTFGTDEISQTVTENGTTRTDIFGHDGHGSVRVLIDAAGAILTLAGIEQLYLYDAYGNLLNMQANQAGTNLLYSGESFDSRIGQQYLRARWYDANTGRFNRLDPFFGNQNDPQSFHKYAYSNNDSINMSDPTGLESLATTIGSLAVGTSLMSIAIGAVIGGVIAEGFYFIATPSEQWTATGALAALSKGALMGGFGTTVIGGAWFILQGLYQGISVWKDPNATPMQKALASVGILMSIASAYFLKGQVRSQVSEWQYVYSKIPLGTQVQTDLAAIRTAFNAGDSGVTIGGTQIAFINRPGRAGGVLAGQDDFFYLTPEAFAQSDDFLMHTIIEENVHLYRMKTAQGLGSLSERGVNHASATASEEGIVGQLTDDIFQIGRERKWW